MPPLTTVYDLVRRIDLDGAKSGTWFVTLAQSNGPIIEEFIEEISVQFDASPRIIDGKGSTPSELSSVIEFSVKDDILVLTGLEEWNAQAWRELDIYRSKLAREGPVILWLGATGLICLAQNAPNLRSWIGGHISRCPANEVY